MFAVLAAGFNYLLSFLLRGVVIKFVIMAALFYLVQLLTEILFSYLPSWFGFSGLFNSISPEVWYFLDLVAFDAGLPFVVAAYGTRFLIRRIPFIG